MAKRDIISKKTRLEFREYFVGTSLRQISQEFDAADVPFDADYKPPEDGQRRSLVEHYYHAVDFSLWRDVRKVLRVYENVLVELEERLKNRSWGDRQETLTRTLSGLVRCLERDGFQYRDGRIVPVKHNSAIEDLSATAQALDAHVLHQQIERIRASLDDDPALAIGTAKELVETTCKTVLADYGIQAKSSWDISRLVKEARAVLRLVPEDIPDSAKGAEVIKRVLSNRGQISQGIAELRNMYGTGHGKDGRAKGLGPRHARLAVGCSIALASFLFETHEARQQP
jgi:hypothetical protein